MGAEFLGCPAYILGNGFSYSSRVSTGFPKAREQMIPFLGGGSSSKGMQDSPLSSFKILKPTMVKCFCIHLGEAYFKSLAVKIPWLLRRLVCCLPIPQTSSTGIVLSSSSISEVSGNIKDSLEGFILFSDPGGDFS